MTIDINTAVKDIEKLLEEEKDISPAMSAAIKMLLLVIKLMGIGLGSTALTVASLPQATRIEKK